MVPLVGEDGSGKAALLRLLCRLCYPTDGVITFDGIDLPQFETRALRRQISVLLQAYAYCNLTALERVWFGNIDLPPDLERTGAAAAYAGAAEVISGLPHDCAAILGR